MDSGNFWNRGTGRENTKEQSEKKPGLMKLKQRLMKPKPGLMKSKPGQIKPLVIPSIRQREILQKDYIQPVSLSNRFPLVYRRMRT